MRQSTATVMRSDAIDVSEQDVAKRLAVVVETTKFVKSCLQFLAHEYKDHLPELEFERGRMLDTKQSQAGRKQKPRRNLVLQRGFLF